MSELQLLNRIENDTKWFNDNYTDIENEFRNKYVAIENGQVIESDKSFDRLLNKLKEMSKDPSDFLIKFVHRIGSVIFL